MKSPAVKSPTKIRLDQLLVDRGLADSRHKAQALILAGEVMLNGQKADKPGRTVPQDCEIAVTGRQRYVSRGGLKLEAALHEFAIPVEGRICIDIGASTGGFTDCLLQHGATHVYAVDTGAGQIDWKLRTDPRVTLFENTNARYLEPQQIPQSADLLVCDASFISLTLLLPRFPALLKPTGEMILLVKPQFEVGREQVGKGGIVRDPQLHQAACAKVRGALVELHYQTRIVPSPILGGEGNQEFLLHARH